MPTKIRMDGPDRRVVGGPTNVVRPQPAVTEVRGTITIIARSKPCFFDLNNFMPKNIAISKERKAVNVRKKITISINFK
jgi:hypothetical protein